MLCAPPITVNPNEFPDDYNYPTGSLVQALKANDGLYHLFVNGCKSACAYKESLCNVRTKNMGLFSYSSTENIPKDWINLECMLDVKDQASPIALMKVCAQVCTENACYGDDYSHLSTREFCRKLCCQTAVNIKESLSSASNAKADANTFIQNCHGMQSFGDNGICQNYSPARITSPQINSRIPANVMRPNTRNMILNSPMQSHPNIIINPPMRNNAMREKMYHLPQPAVNHRNPIKKNIVREKMVHPQQPPVNHHKPQKGVKQPLPRKQTDPQK